MINWIWKNDVSSEKNRWNLFPLFGHFIYLKFESYTDRKQQYMVRISSLLFFVFFSRNSKLEVWIVQRVIDYCSYIVNQSLKRNQSMYFFSFFSSYFSLSFSFFSLSFLFFSFLPLSFSFSFSLYSYFSYFSLSFSSEKAPACRYEQESARQEVNLLHSIRLAPFSSFYQSLY